MQLNITVNVETNRKVRIKSAQRLRRPSGAGGKKMKVMSKAEYEAGAKPDADDEKAARSAARDVGKVLGVPVGVASGKKAKKSAKDTKPVAKADTGERAATGGNTDGKPMSLLDAAAHLLSLGTGDPMRCQTIVDLAIARGLWTPRSGRTPANTLYAAISREIKLKGDASRFVKADRGKFVLNRRITRQ